MNTFKFFGPGFIPIIPELTVEIVPEVQYIHFSKDHKQLDIHNCQVSYEHFSSNGVIMVKKNGYQKFTWYLSIVSTSIFTVFLRFAISSLMIFNWWRYGQMIPILDPHSPALIKWLIICLHRTASPMFTSFLLWICSTQFCWPSVLTKTTSFDGSMILLNSYDWKQNK